MDTDELDELIRLYAEAEPEPDASFAEIGGDSLAAALIADSIERELGITVEIAWFFEAPTMRDLYNSIADAARESGRAGESDRAGERPA